MFTSAPKFISTWLGNTDLRIIIASIVALILSGVIIYSTGFGLFYPIEQRGGIYIASILIVICKIGSERYKKLFFSTQNLFLSLIDILIIFAAAFSIYRFIVVQRAMSNDLYDIETLDILACALGLSLIHI